MLPLSDSPCNSSRPDRMVNRMNVDKVVVLNTETEEIGEIRRTLFESEIFNPGGLLLLEVEDSRSGCVDCGVEPSNAPDEVSDSDEDDALEDETLDEEED